MDRLMTMTTFAKVVKYSSFTAAAEDLGISRTLVSRHIADLESHLGVRLLNRTTRSVTPTQAGMRYHDLCENVLGEIRSGEEEITAIRDEIQGDIAILCPIWIGSFGISEATAEFCALNPRINVKLHFAEPPSNPHEFLDMGYDICIQLNWLRDSSIMVKKIAEVDYILAASPGYVEAHGAPAEIGDLAAHKCLTKLTDTSWAFIGGDRVSLPTHARYSTNSVFSLCGAAAAGLGIAMLPTHIATRDLNNGKLLRILPDHKLEPRPLYVAYAPGGGTPKKFRALITFLSQRFADGAVAPYGIDPSMADGRPQNLQEN
jgi:DNA-binding transcriptional LysR family regulator